MIDTKELQLTHLGQARDDYLRPQKIREEYDDTFTSVLGLRFEISRHHFRQGVIRLKCSSSLLTIYWQSSMVIFASFPPRLSIKPSMIATVIFLPDLKKNNLPITDFKQERSWQENKSHNTNTFSQL